MIFDFVIVGRGILGLFALYVLSKNQNKKNINVLWVGENKGASFVPYAIASTYGAEVGVSPLGDLIVNSFNALSLFIKQNQPIGIFDAKHFYFGDQDHLAFLKRFKNTKVFLKDFSFGPVFLGHSFLIQTELYFHWLLKEIQKNRLINLFIEDTKCSLVLNSKKNEYYLKDYVSNKEYFSSKIFIATGADISCFEQISSLNFYLKLKINKGAFFYNDEKILKNAKITTRKNHNEFFSTSEIMGSSLSHPLLKNAFYGDRAYFSDRMPLWYEDKNSCFFIGAHKNGHLFPYFYENKIKNFFLI